MKPIRFAVTVIWFLAWTIVIIVADLEENNTITIKRIPLYERETSKVNYVREHIFSGPIQSQTTENKTQEVNIVSTTEPTRTFLDWYEDGVSSYLSKDWSNCVDNLLHAINGYRDYYSATASCRTQCSGVARQVAPFFDDNVDDLHYYESVVRRTLCLVKCKRLLLPSIPEFFHMNQWSKEVFQTGKPYTYIQMCYFKVFSIYLFSIKQIFP